LAFALGNRLPSLHKEQKNGMELFGMRTGCPVVNKMGKKGKERGAKVETIKLFTGSRRNANTFPIPCLAISALISFRKGGDARDGGVHLKLDPTRDIFDHPLLCYS